MTNPQSTDSFMFNIAVCGAHMQGLPLNPQLRDLGGAFVIATKTAPCYKLFKLAGFEPARPGLVRVNHSGYAIDLEVWQLPASAFGQFVTLIPAPLCIGSILLEDQESVIGFLCESYATEDATDISSLQGWRGYLDTLTK